MHDEQTLRSHQAYSREEAENLIEALVDTYAERSDVIWQSEEPDDKGMLYGLAHGVVYVIAVNPPLNVELA